MLHSLYSTPEIALVVAGLASVAGRLLLHGPHIWKRRWKACLSDLLLSAVSGSLSAVLLPALWAAPLSLVGAGLVGFAVGAVWGPRGLWRLAGLLILKFPAPKRSPPPTCTPPPPHPSGAPAKKVLD